MGSLATSGHVKRAAHSGVGATIPRGFLSAIEARYPPGYNMGMIVKLTDEQRVALEANPGAPLRMEDPHTHKVYLVFSEESLPTLWEDYIRREVEKGLAAIERGEVEDWDVESIKAEGRRFLG